MAGETLKTVDELLADYPDQQSGAIEAVHVRNDLISTVVAVGFLEDDPAQTPYTIPLTSGVPQDVLSTLVTPQFAGNFWALDGNNAFVPDYVPRGIVVQPGTQRLSQGTVYLLCNRAGGGQPSLYEFQGTEGGIFTGNPQLREIAPGDPQLVVLEGTRLYDVYNAGAISFSVTPIGHSNDLEVSGIRVVLEGTLV